MACWARARVSGNPTLPSLPSVHNAFAVLCGSRSPLRAAARWATEPGRVAPKGSSRANCQDKFPRPRESRLLALLRACRHVAAAAGLSATKAEEDAHLPFEMFCGSSSVSFNCPSDVMPAIRALPQVPKRPKARTALDRLCTPRSEVLCVVAASAARSTGVA